MNRFVSAFALLVAAAAPAAAGGDWEDRYSEGYAVREYWQGDYRGYGVPAYVPHIYVPYGSYYADIYVEEPYVAQRFVPDRECTIKRKWRNGRMTEKIKCDDD